MTTAERKELKKAQTELKRVEHFLRYVPTGAEAYQCLIRVQRARGRLTKLADALEATP